MTWFPTNPGIDIRTDTVPGTAERYEAYFKAGAAIAVGKPVVHDMSVDTGIQVITHTVALGPLFAGVYEGKGGTGAQTATTGLTGKAALTNDLIRVCQTGICSSFVHGSASNAALGASEALSLGLVAGVFIAVADITTAAYLSPSFSQGTVSSQGAASTDGQVAKVYVRGLR